MKDITLFYYLIIKFYLKIYYTNSAGLLRMF